jgi:hypothetical protein
MDTLQYGFRTPTTCVLWEFVHCNGLYEHSSQIHTYYCEGNLIAYAKLYIKTVYYCMSSKIHDLKETIQMNV